jgi:DNA-binding response OmpR family regulator
VNRGRILVVEDDPAILAGLREKLRGEGYEVREAMDGEAARDALAAGPLDLVVLDLMLPRLDGLSVLRWLRKRTQTLPVLILSAKGSETEKVEGLAAGADDYLAKPFGLRELMARIQALLRRTGKPERTLKLGDVVLDLGTRKVLRGKREVKLSPKETDILFLLARNPGRTVSREEILDAAWGSWSESATRAVDFHILHLRRKIEPDPANPRYILTRHGSGYELGG